MGIGGNLDFLVKRKDGTIIHLSFSTIDNAIKFLSHNSESMGIDPDAMSNLVPCNEKDVYNHFSKKTPIKGRRRRKRKNDICLDSA